MRKAGGIISLVASIIAVLMAIITLFVGGIGGAFDAEGAGTIIGFGWAGLFLSFVLIVFSAIIITSPSKKISIAIIVLSIVTAIVGGTLVAIFMVLTILGGILGFVGSKKEIASEAVQ